MKITSIHIVILLFLTSGLLHAAAPVNTIDFQTLIAENGEQHLKIHLTWEDDPDITAFKIYSVPSNTLVFVCLKNTPPGEHTEQLMKLNSKCVAVGISEATAEINDYLIEGDDGFRLTKVIKKDMTEEELATVKVDDYTGIYQVGAVFSLE